MWRRPLLYTRSATDFLSRLRCQSFDFLVNCVKKEIVVKKGERAQILIIQQPRAEKFPFCEEVPSTRQPVVSFSIHNKTLGEEEEDQYRLAPRTFSILTCCTSSSKSFTSISCSNCFIFNAHSRSTSPQCSARASIRVESSAWTATTSTASSPPSPPRRARADSTPSTTRRLERWQRAPDDEARRQFFQGDRSARRRRDKTPSTFRVDSFTRPSPRRRSSTRFPSVGVVRCPVPLGGRSAREEFAPCRLVADRFRASPTLWRRSRRVLVGDRAPLVRSCRCLIGWRERDEMPSKVSRWSWREKRNRTITLITPEVLS